MIKDIDNKDLLQRLAKYQNFLQLLSILNSDEKQVLKSLADHFTLICRLDKLNGLQFLRRCDAQLMPDVMKLIDWDNDLIWKLLDDPENIRIVYNMWDGVDDLDAFVDAYFDLTKHPDFAHVNCLDAFSAGQIASKRWLCDVVQQLNVELGLTWILCGWIGTLAYLLDEHRTGIKIGKIRSFDKDQRCAGLAEALNRKAVIDDWRFKASTFDVNAMGYTGWHYETSKHDGTMQVMYEKPDCVINTSCDHMGHDDTWFRSIPSETLVILQNNDWHDNDQHSSTVDDLATFIARYPLAKMLYNGELDCNMYRRFMLIGYK